MRLFLLMTVCLLAVDNATATAPRSECDVVKQKIRIIQSKMRAGYTRAQGEKMEAKLRELREVRLKVCR